MELFALKDPTGKLLEKVKGEMKTFSFVRFQREKMPVNIQVYVNSARTFEQYRYLVDHRGITLTARIRDSIQGNTRKRVEDNLPSPHFLTSGELKEMQVKQAENMFAEIKELLNSSAPAGNTPQQG